MVKNYTFVKNRKECQWDEQPSFEGDLGSDDFVKAAGKAEEFFRAIKDDDNPWQNLLRTKSKTNLLYITAARYIFVTHILWLQSNKKLISCKERRDVYNNVIQDFEIPQTGVCFPKPYGSATYKSDYDVGLIGKDSGTLTMKFNGWFQNNFGKPSELVFDTNVYAFTLEFAMPSMFLKLPNTFADKVAKLEKTVKYKMQELASAYYKVFKYNVDVQINLQQTSFFDMLKNGATGAMTNTAPQSLVELNRWLGTFSGMNRQLALKQGQNSLKDFRLAHNNHYQTLVASISTNGGYKPELIGTLSP